MPLNWDLNRIKWVMVWKWLIDLILLHSGIAVIRRCWDIYFNFKAKFIETKNIFFMVLSCTRLPRHKSRSYLQEKLFATSGIKFKTNIFFWAMINCLWSESPANIDRYFSFLYRHWHYINMTLTRLFQSWISIWSERALK